MQPSHVLSANVENNRALCPLCKAEMNISCIEPSKPDHDRRTFECVCGHSEVRVVKYR